MFNFRLILISLFSISLNLSATSFKEIKTFEANFSQTITNPSGNKALYNGILHIKEPDSIKWQYKNPIEKYVYIKKHAVTIIEPDLEQAIITNLEKEINVLNLLRNATKVSNNSYKSHFNNIEYTLTLKNETLKQISYKDEIENNVLISFRNVQQNHNIDNKVFNFSIPIDFDIIKK